MAKKLTVAVQGNTPKPDQQARTVQELMDRLKLDGNYAVTVNGDPVQANHCLSDYDYITFAAAVKGGAN